MIATAFIRQHKVRPQQKTTSQTYPLFTE